MDRVLCSENGGQLCHSVEWEASFCFSQFWFFHFEHEYKSNSYFDCVTEYVQSCGWLLLGYSYHVKVSLWVLLFWHCVLFLFCDFPCLNTLPPNGRKENKKIHVECWGLLLGKVTFINEPGISQENVRAFKMIILWEESELNRKGAVRSAGGKSRTQLSLYSCRTGNFCGEKW